MIARHSYPRVRNAIASHRRYDKIKNIPFRKGGRQNMNEYEEVLTELRQQEEEIQFASFTNDTALAVGIVPCQSNSATSS